MKIALLGYGKMGQAIEKIALEKGHKIVLKINLSNCGELTKETLQQCDVAIEFTNPASAVQNLKTCFDATIPVVCGSTGWLAHLAEVKKYCEEKNGTFLYASNFSIGVNIFFEVNNYLAKLMSTHKEYNVELTEIHHTQKKDAPSGTAITLAEQILQHSAGKTKWVNEAINHPDFLVIHSKRIENVAGTHTTKYTSPIDDIEITHTAHNRIGFASGAVCAAEFIEGKKGIFTMKQVLGF